MAVAAIGAFNTLSLPPDEAATPATRDSFPASMALVNSLSSRACFFSCGFFTGLSNLPADARKIILKSEQGIKINLAGIYMRNDLSSLFARLVPTYPSYFLLISHDDLLLLPFSCLH